MYILDHMLFDFLLKILDIAKKKRNDKSAPLIIRSGAWLVCIVDIVVRYILIPAIFGVLCYIVFIHKKYTFLILMFALFIFSFTPHYRVIKKFIRKRPSVNVNDDPFDMDNEINYEKDKKVNEKIKTSYPVKVKVMTAVASAFLIFPLVLFFVLFINQEYKSSLYSIQFTIIDVINVFAFYGIAICIYHFNKKHIHNLCTVLSILAVVVFNYYLFSNSNLSSYLLFKTSTTYVVFAIIGSLVLSVILFRIRIRMINNIKNIDYL